jgi:hypothetical protein
MLSCLLGGFPAPLWGRERPHKPENLGGGIPRQKNYCMEIYKTAKIVKVENNI